MSVCIVLVILIAYKLLMEPKYEHPEDYYKSNIKDLEKEIEELKKDDGYIRIRGYVPTEINNKDTFTYDHVDQCIAKNPKNFICTSYGWGAFVDSFDSNKDFTLTKLRGASTYIKEYEYEQNDKDIYDDKAEKILGVKILDKESEITDDLETINNSGQ